MLILSAGNFLSLFFMFVLSCVLGLLVILSSQLNLMFHLNKLVLSVFCFFILDSFASKAVDLFGHACQIIAVTM